MLEKIDLNKRLSKKEYKKVLPALELRLSELQRVAKEKDLPIMFLFEGFSAAGKGSMINRLIFPLDPRGFKLFVTDSITSEEELRPFLWRYSTETPEKGITHLFIRGWYRGLLYDLIDKNIKKKIIDEKYNDIKSFEKQLADDGTLIIKFFMHVSKKEQKNRLKDLEKDKVTSWRVNKDDWRLHKEYKKIIEVADEMLKVTDTDYAPWTVVEADDRKFATVKIFEKAIESIEKALNGPKTPELIISSREILPLNDKMNSTVLDGLDLNKKMDKTEYEKLLKKYQKEIKEIEYKMFLKRIPLIIAFEGWDAAGKGGAIKRLTERMDPRGYEVIPIGVPTDVEKRHHYLWRFWRALPKAGHLAIFDRTWYGRVLVERVEGFAKEYEWKRAYREINEFEEQLTNFGTILIKFWLQIDSKEQLKRFKEREHNKDKQWKITEEDWRNRKKWDLYKSAVDEMLVRTSTLRCPWTIIESENKYYERIKVLKTVVNTVNRNL